MIDNYQKEAELLSLGHDEFYLATLQGSQLSRMWYEEIGVDNMKDAVREKGEADDDVKRIWLSDLNGVCNIDGHTDIMCAHLGVDGALTFQVNSPDDKSTIFVDIDDFNYSVADLIYDQVINYKN